MARKKKGREWGRCKHCGARTHEGVKIVARTLPRTGNVSHVARWIDPDSGKQRAQSLDKLDLTTKAQRCDWAIVKAKQIRGRADDLTRGATPHAEANMAAALEKTISDAVATGDIKESTAETYRFGAARFAEWCGANGIKTGDELKPALLTKFRTDLATQKARVNVKGEGKRGARTEGRRKQSPASINNRLRSVKAVLNRMRRAGQLPYISRDDLGDHLREIKFKKKREFLRKPQIKALLKAAAKHDEKDPGTPMTELILFFLLSGCRRDEALQFVTWDGVDLEAPDERGETVGEFHVSDGKTGSRTATLSISPGLRRMLTAMKLRSSGRHVFGGGEPWTRAQIDARRKILVSEHGAPAFTWQALRATCGTFQCNAPSLWGAASIYMTAKQLGHRVDTCEKHYAGVLKGLPRDVHTLEGLMGIEKQVEKVIKQEAA